MQENELQSLFDLGGDIDLGGELVSVRRLRVTRPVSLKNAKLFSPSDNGTTDKRYGIVEVGQGGVAKFTNVHFTGPLSDYTDDFRVNQARARQQGAFCAGVHAITGRPERLSFYSCKFNNLFAGVGAFGTYNVTVSGCQFEKIAGHSVVTSVPADNDRVMYCSMRNCSSRDVGSLFDFSAPDSTVVPPVIPRAVVSGCRAVNTLGRTKVAGPWKVDIVASDFRITRPLPVQFTGIDIPQAVSVTLDDVEISGYPAGGVWCNGFVTQPVLNIRNSSITGGQLAINSTGITTITDSQISDCYAPWGSSVPNTSNVAVVNNVAVATIAGYFVALRSMVREWNRSHGTQYDVDQYWWLDKPIRDAVLKMESQ